LKSRPSTAQLRAFLDAEVRRSLSRAPSPAAVTSGPKSALGSVDGPIFRLSTRGISLSISRSAVFSPTGTATEIAMQRSPAEPYPAPISASTAWSMSASGMTIMWFLAPPKHWTRFAVGAAAP
jgi:hypothetical protein